MSSGGATAAGVQYILAEASVRYHQRVLWPSVLDVGVRVSFLGKKHFRMIYEVRSQSGEKLLSGHTVQVWFDYAAGKSARMPDEVLAVLAAHDGPFASSGEGEQP